MASSGALEPSLEPGNTSWAQVGADSTHAAAPPVRTHEHVAARTLASRGCHPGMCQETQDKEYPHDCQCVRPRTGLSPPAQYIVRS